MIYCFKTTEDARLWKMLPAGYEGWCIYALEYLREAAPHSPALAKDAEIASILCETMMLL